MVVGYCYLLFVVVVVVGGGGVVVVENVAVVAVVVVVLLLLLLLLLLLFFLPFTAEINWFVHFKWALDFFSPVWPFRSQHFLVLYFRSHVFRMLPMPVAAVENSLKAKLERQNFRILLRICEFLVFEWAIYCLYVVLRKNFSKL